MCFYDFFYFGIDSGKVESIHAINWACMAWQISKKVEDENKKKI